MEPSSGGTSTAPAQSGAQAIGRSRRGLTTEIVALVEALGNLLRFVLLPGQRHDSVGVAPLLKHLAFAALLADKAFDTGSSWVSGCWRRSRGVRPSDPCPIADHVFLR